MIIGNREFDTSCHTYIMGILNVTPDSFSDGGQHTNIDDILRHVDKMVNEGTDIIDIGGESTRPGYTRISDEEEIGRVIPAIEAIKSRFDIPLSLDTYKSKVAKAGIEAGVHMINDIWGLKADVNMASVVAQSKSAVCLMHNKEEASYNNLVEDVLFELKESVDIAKAAGIADDRIVLDPGVGFAKSYEDNLVMIKEIGKLHSLGYPVLLGASRKSCIGLTLDLPADERLEGTLVTTMYAVINHAAFVRVHDIEANRRVIQMAEAIRDI